MARVLIVEDDEALRDLLARTFAERGADVLTAVDGRSALECCESRPDLVVLDVGLPDADGRDVCLALRARGLAAPVLFLTARGGVHDRLQGFSAGGDDYVVKPFHLAELFARVRVLLRGRTSDLRLSPSGLRLDPARLSIANDQVELALSPTEFRLVATLVGRAGEVVSRSDLVEAAWPHGAIVSPNTLEQYVRRLRARLAELGADDVIVTVRGVGYRLVTA